MGCWVTSLGCSKVLLGTVLASKANRSPNIMTQPNGGLFLAHPPVRGECSDQWSGSPPRDQPRRVPGVTPPCLPGGPVAICIQLMEGRRNPGRSFGSDVVHFTSFHVLLVTTSHMAASSDRESGKFRRIRAWPHSYDWGWREEVRADSCHRSTHPAATRGREFPPGVHLPSHLLLHKPAS